VEKVINFSQKVDDANVFGMIFALTYLLTYLLTHLLTYLLTISTSY
jgi:hypothetical protein